MLRFISQKYESIFTALIEKEIEDNPSSGKRELINNITTSLIDASIEKYKLDKSGQVVESSNGSDVDNFWNDQNFKQEFEQDTPPLSDNERIEVIETDDSEQFEPSSQSSGGSVKQREHFLDIFVDRLINKLVTERLPEREQLAERLIESDEAIQQQPISATTLGSNFGKLGSNLTAIFDLQETIIRLITWRNPSGTIALLFFLTFLIHYPLVILLLPTINLLFRNMIPSYVHRHPSNFRKFPIKKVYGKSLIEDIATGGPSNAWHPKDNIETTQFSSSNPGSGYENMSGSYDLSAKNQAHGHNSSVEVIANLRDLQHVTSSMVELDEKLERFFYGTAGFKDEVESTLFFFTCLIGLFISLGFFYSINWSLFLSFTLWISMIIIHPKIKPYLRRISKLKRTANKPIKNSKGENHLVILDEKPEVQYVEVFEIYKKGMTSYHWDFCVYSNQMYDPDDPSRKLENPPQGVESLKDISPPRTWSFDKNFDWEIDADAKSWVREKGLSLIADQDFARDDEFKRRRWIRKILRYAKPARKPHDFIRH